MSLYLGIDVGTGSARAGLFDARGVMRGSCVKPIETWKPQEDFVEQSSDDIWRACGEAVRGALAQAGANGEDVRGIGFDATCSLVLLDEKDAPVTVSPTGRDAQNVIVWMDHRAIAEADRINAGAHEVLRSVGGVISPEMETPKLAWLKQHMKASFDRAARFLDLPDFLTYRATGVDVRSLCTTVCKWTYLGHEGRWDDAYFRAIGLSELADEGFRRIGTQVRPMGERVGGLTAKAAKELGLAEGTPVSVSIIDAHAGGVGTIGAAIDGEAPPDEAAGEDTRSSRAIERRLALIGGTSSCHMAVSREPRFIRGVWGPYHSAMIPGLWLTEGGQSATGALIDHVIQSHPRAAELGPNVHARLADELEKMARDVKFPAELTRDLHVLPDHHGNRSPRADPTLRGMVSGLKLREDVGGLALLYLATLQAIALGTRHIVEAMKSEGYRIDTIVASGGHSKNPIFLREHADATGCRVVLPREADGVLLGSAILGAVASGDHPSIVSAMSAMSAAGQVITPSPAGSEVARYHDAKFRVFLRMHDDQLAYRAEMNQRPPSA